MYSLRSLLFFDVPLVYYYDSSQIINIFCHFGISLGISLSFYELLCITLKNVCYFLLFHYFNLSSSSCSYLFSGHTHLSLGISLSRSFVIFYEIFSDEFFETFVILLVILFPIKSLHSPAVFEQLFLKNRTFLTLLPSN